MAGFSRLASSLRTSKVKCGELRPVGYGAMDGAGRPQGRCVVLLRRLDLFSRAVMAPRLVDLTGSTRRSKPRGIHPQRLEQPLAHQGLPRFARHLLGHQAGQGVADIGVGKRGPGPALRSLTEHGRQAGPAAFRSWCCRRAATRAPLAGSPARCVRSCQSVTAWKSG